MSERPSPVERDPALFDPSQVELLYNRINRTAREITHNEGEVLVELERSRSGEVVVNTDEVLGLLSLFHALYDNPRDGNAQTLRLLASLHGETPQHIADEEGHGSAHAITEFKIDAGDRIARKLYGIFYEPETHAPQSIPEGAEDLLAFLGPIRDQLTPRQRKVLEARYNPRGGVIRTQREAADELQVTQSTIRDIERRVWSKFSGGEKPPEIIVKRSRRLGERVEFRVGRAVSSLTIRQAEIMNMRYNPEGDELLPPQVVADALGISVERVMFVEQEILKQFPDLATALGRGKDLDEIPLIQPDSEQLWNAAANHAELARLYGASPEESQTLSDEANE